MRKFYICLALILGVVLEADAQTRTLEQMTDIAVQAMQSVKKQPVYGIGTPQKRPQLTVAMNSPELAVFNADGGGWVMISADERTNGSVLAYSPDGSFNWASAPDNVKEWVAGYTKQIQSLGDLKTVIADDSENGPGTPVVDALISTKWGQEYPFNLLCPSTSLKYSDDLHFMTGCEATAMAQVLNYWKYNSTDAFRPIHTNVISPSETVDYSQANYNWDNMADTYLFKTDTVRNERRIITGYGFHPENFTEEQANEVARLMYDCGTALDMQYDTDGSGAYEYIVISALLSCYDYSTDVRLVDRNTFQGNWDDMLRMEFDAHRPVIYGGYDKSYSNGHSFICDGYDDHGYFHFNFGWSGDCDGYYKTTAVNPNGYSLSYYQDAIIGIHPATGNDRCVWQDGISFYRPDTENAVMLHYNDNGNVTKLVTPDFVDIDGKLRRIDIPSCSSLGSSILKETVLKGVANLEKEAFAYCDSLEYVTFDTCFQKADKYAFANCSGLCRVTIQNTEPPVFVKSAFYNSIDQAALVVPEGCVPVYQNASGWNGFAYIIDEIVPDTICLAMTNLEMKINNYFTFTASNSCYAVEMTVRDDHPVGTFSIGDLFLKYCKVTDSTGKTHPFLTADITVSLAEDGFHYKVTGAISCADGTVFILDLSYAVPEKTRSVTLEITDGYVNDYIKDSGTLLCLGRSSDPDVYVKLAFSTDALEGAVTLADFNSKETYLIEYPDSSNVRYGLADGSLTTAIDGENIICTGKLLFQAADNVSDVPEYSITMVCKYIPGQYADDTSDQDFSATFSGKEIDIDTSYFEDFGAVEIIADNRNYGISMILLTESLDEGNIPAGVYTIDGSWYLGTVVASDGYDGEYFSQSFACTLSSGRIDKVWLFESGTVTVSYSDNIMLIEADARNYFDRSIKFTMTKELTSRADTIPLGISKAYYEDVRDTDGAFLIYGQHPVDNIYFELYIDCDELEGTFTIDDIDTYNSFLMDLSGSDYCDYIVLDGNITVTAEGDHSIVTGTLVLQNYHYPSDIVNYIVNMTCFFVPKEFSLDAMVREFNASFSGSQVSVETQSPERDGQVLVMGQASDKSIALAFCIGSLDGGNIPAGEYIISSSHEKGTVMASEGEIAMDVFTPSYAISGPNIWFIVSGTVTVSYSDGSMLIDVDAENYRGCPIRAALSKESVPTYVMPFKADAQSNAYDLNGVPVTDGYHGIVITNGKKYLR